MQIKQRTTAVERRAQFTVMPVVRICYGKVCRDTAAAGGSVEIHASVAGQADMDAATGSVKTALLFGLPAERRRHGASRGGGVNRARYLFRVNPAAGGVRFDPPRDAVNRNRPAAGRRIHVPGGIGDRNAPAGRMHNRFTRGASDRNASAGGAAVHRSFATIELD